MIITDQIGDMLTRIRNAAMVRHDTVEMPASKLKMAVLKILKEEGFISDFELVKGKPERSIKIRLKYGDNNQSIISGIERVSKPGLRVFRNIMRYRGFTVVLNRYFINFQRVITWTASLKQKIGEKSCNVW
jgi:ribosomal protein S8